MKNSQLNRVVRLISKTHDKAIVLDGETEEVVVMLPLENYENMVGLDTYDDLPPLGGGDSDWTPHFDFGPGETSEEKIEDGGETDELDNDFDFEEGEPIEPTVEPLEPAKKPFAIPEKRLNFAENWQTGAGNSSIESEENLGDLPHDEEEEKFYLEPVE